jgi:hypothetical protein
MLQEISRLTSKIEQLEAENNVLLKDVSEFRNMVLKYADVAFIANNEVSQLKAENNVLLKDVGD